MMFFQRTGLTSVLISSLSWRNRTEQSFTRIEQGLFWESESWSAGQPESISAADGTYYYAVSWSDNKEGSSWLV